MTINVRESIPSLSGANVVSSHTPGKPVHSFQVDKDGCFFVIVGRAVNLDGVSVGGYRLTVTDEGAPPHPAKDDRHSPLMYDSEDVVLISPHRPGMKAFITGDSHTEGGTTYTPSTSMGNVPGDGRMDSFDDIDLFKRRLDAGKYDVIVRSQAGETSSNKGTARRSGNGKIRLAFSVYDSAGEWVTLLEASGGREVNAFSASPSACSPTSSSDEEYTCRNTAYATVQIDRSGEYFVAVKSDFLSRNNPQTGDYSVEIRAVQDPSLSRLQSVPSGISDTRLAVRATVLKSAGRRALPAIQESHRHRVDQLRNGSDRRDPPGREVCLVGHTLHLRPRSGYVLQPAGVTRERLFQRGPDSHRPDDAGPRESRGSREATLPTRARG